MSGQPQRVQRMMTLPINIIFRLLQHKQRVQLWLYDHTNLRIEGKIIGLDEYMNLVLDDVEEIRVKANTRRNLGRILLKGDSITLIQAAPTQEES
jgi:small nuclear ribonucleoprotein E